MGLFTKMFLLSICISVMFLILVPDGMTPSNSCSIYSKFFTVQNNSIQPGSNFTAAIPVTVETGSAGTGTSLFGVFVDPIKFVLNFLFFLYSLVFPVLACGGGLGFPVWLQILLSIPPLFTLLGLIYFARGGSGN